MAHRLCAPAAVHARRGGPTDKLRGTAGVCDSSEAPQSRSMFMGCQASLCKSLGTTVNIMEAVTCLASSGGQMSEAHQAVVGDGPMSTRLGVVAAREGGAGGAVSADGLGFGQERSTRRQ